MCVGSGASERTIGQAEAGHILLLLSARRRRSEAAANGSRDSGLEEPRKTGVIQLGTGVAELYEVQRSQPVRK